MQNLPAQIGEICFKMESARTVPAVREFLRSIVDILGVTYFLLGMRSGNKVSPVVQIIISNYPKHWQRYYDDNGAIAFDPVFNTALKFGGPFRWDGLHKTPQQMRLREMSMSCGMNYGLSTADRGPDASVALLSFCGLNRICEDEGQWLTLSAALSLVASSVHKALARAIEERAGADDATAPLRMVELKALTLISKGSTAEQAGRTLGVSTRTVRYYLDRVVEKLGAVSRKEALTMAVAQGLIETRTVPDLKFGGQTENIV